MLSVCWQAGPVPDRMLAESGVAKLVLVCQWVGLGPGVVAGSRVSWSWYWPAGRWNWSPAHCGASASLLVGTAGAQGL